MINVDVTEVVANHGSLIEFAGTATINDTCKRVNFFSDVVHAAAMAWALDRGEEVVASVPSYMLGRVTEIEQVA